MGEVIFEAFERLVRGRPGYKARSWYNIDCPCCGDRRKRGGFSSTQTGGFRYYCQNGGCAFHDKPTGWEPGNGLRGRLADLFTRLGGSINSLPKEEVNKIKIIDGTQPEQKRDIRLSFPAVNLPAAAIPLIEAIDTNPRSHEVGDWLVSKRSQAYLYPENHKYLYWSPLSPRTLCIGFVHYERIVGYLNRDITKGDGAARFMQRSEEGYLFGQHRVTELPGEYVPVVESPMDAILIHGVATRSSRPSTWQINFLLQCGKTPIMIPDLKDAEGLKFIEVAEANKWPIAVPKWPCKNINGGEIKDPGEAFIPYGVLNTAALIRESVTYNYTEAKLRMKMMGR